MMQVSLKTVVVGNAQWLRGRLLPVVASLAKSSQPARLFLSSLWHMHFRCECQESTVYEQSTNPWTNVHAEDEHEGSAKEMVYPGYLSRLQCG